MHFLSSLGGKVAGLLKAPWNWWTAATISPTGRYGVQVLANPPAADLDIVFVAGLTGDRITTWTHQNGFFWPGEPLSKLFPKARIMTYGYDADPVAWRRVGGDSLRNNGNALAHAISNERSGIRRPVIWLVHSLGGLVCEQALVLCKESTTLQPLLDHTFGICFMGVPHGGSHLASWGTSIISYSNFIKRANVRLVDDLDPTSPALQAVEHDFQQMLRHGGITIHLFSFYEKIATRRFGYIVPFESARIAGEPYNGIDQDHEGMTKPEDERDETFLRIIHVLRGWVATIATGSQLATESTSRTSNSTETLPRIRNVFSGQVTTTGDSYEGFQSDGGNVLIGTPQTNVLPRNTMPRGVARNSSRPQHSIENCFQGNVSARTSYRGFSTNGGDIMIASAGAERRE